MKRRTFLGSMLAPLAMKVEVTRAASKPWFPEPEAPKSRILYIGLHIDTRDHDGVSVDSNGVRLDIVAPDGREIKDHPFVKTGFGQYEAMVNADMPGKWAARFVAIDKNGGNQILVNSFQVYDLFDL